MKPEQYFLRYAFPCAFVLLNQKRITKEEYDELEKAFYETKVLSREKLESVFASAFRRIKALAKGKDYWDIEVLREYFVSYHNQCIDEGEGDYSKFPKDFRELCKVKKCRILKKEEDVLTVEMDGVKKAVLGKILPEAKENDYVYVHLGVAVEKI
ncbi:MAG: HypC/HybG/HupF family hydrogenase formation chaperone [Candidatus Woesearchaeota archaeon]